MFCSLVLVTLSLISFAAPSLARCINQTWHCSAIEPKNETGIFPLDARNGTVSV